ncbi:hypothetical protein BC831DRAFT_150240 [Entophlyctis helioformis]|nr:hypothetical protein BC831DRAFT_150240 [Entophlyctis helioformis]
MHSPANSPSACNKNNVRAPRPQVCRIIRVPTTVIWFGPGEPLSQPHERACRAAKNGVMRRAASESAAIAAARYRRMPTGACRQEHASAVTRASQRAAALGWDMHAAAGVEVCTDQPTSRLRTHACHGQAATSSQQAASRPPCAVCLLPALHHHHHHHHHLLLLQCRYRRIPTASAQIAATCVCRARPLRPSGTAPLV